MKLHSRSSRSKSLSAFYADRGNEPETQLKIRTTSTYFASFLASLSYGITSLTMVIMNKGLLMQYKYSTTLLTLQMLASVVLIKIASLLGLVNVKPLTLKASRKLSLLSVCYSANVAFALASLNGINIPMYIAMKRLTPMTVLIAGVAMGKSRPSLQVTLSVLTTVMGCLIAVAGDFSFDIYGYGMALTSVCFQTMYLVLVEKSGAEDGVSSTEIMFYIGVLSLPWLLLLLLLTGEGALSIPLLLKMCTQSSGFTISVLVYLVMGILLNFTMFLCTIVNSALTTTIVGVLKGVGSTIIGFFVLGGVEVHALNVTGLAINSFGGLWYSYAKYRQRRPKLTPILAEPLLPTSVPPRPLS